MNKNPTITHPSLRDICALVTGAGEGIGRATALALARSGAKVGLLGRTESNLEKVHKEISEAGGQSLTLVADITDPERMNAAVVQLTDAFGPIRLLFANAGINGKWAALENFEPGEWEKTININLIGTYHSIRAVLPSMKPLGGSIIITSSINGYRTFENVGASAYSASKAGQAALGKMLALELAGDQIRVNVLCPGAISTNIEESTTYGERVESLKNEYGIPKAYVPLTDGKPGHPDEVANMVCFLASDAGRHISGAVISIDGAESLLYG